MVVAWIVALWLPLLGDRNFRTREWATEKLIAANNAHDLRKFLRARQAREKDAEVRRRLELILDAYTVLPLGELPPLWCFAEKAFPLRGDWELYRVASEFGLIWWNAASEPCLFEAERSNLASSYYLQELFGEGRTRAQVRERVRGAQVRWDAYQKKRSSSPP